MTLEAKFFARVRMDGDCWSWTGGRTEFDYGTFYLGGGRRGRKYAVAHRWSYEFLRAPIPEGLTLDHLCRNRGCVNPWHLEPVPTGVNTLRGEAPSAQNARKSCCVRGHEFTPENTINRRTGGRRCRECMNAYNERVAAARKAG